MTKLLQRKRAGECGMPEPIKGFEQEL